MDNNGFISQNADGSFYGGEMDLDISVKPKPGAAPAPTKKSVNYSQYLVPVIAIAALLLVLFWGKIFT